MSFDYDVYVTGTVDLLTSNVIKLKKSGTKIYMMYNSDNWGSYSSYPSSLKSLLLLF